MGSKKGEVDYAVRRALNKFDEWNDVTGYVPKFSGYYAEIQSVIEDAVHCGFQRALDDEGPLPSEKEHPMTDLSNLPPEVREAIVFLDNSTEDDVDVPDSVRHWQAIRQYAISVTAERDELQGANEYHRLALVLAQKQIAELAAERDARGDSKPLNE